MITVSMVPEHRATRAPEMPAFDDTILPDEVGNVVLPRALSLPRLQAAEVFWDGKENEELGLAVTPEEPDPQWLRGSCPLCGEKLVSNLHFIAGRGYVVRWDCWGLLQARPRCGYFAEL